MCQQIEIRLNDVINTQIQTNGITYVCDNYLQIRENYYIEKELRSYSNNNKYIESSDDECLL